MTHINTQIRAYLKFQGTEGVTIHGTPKPEPEVADYQRHVWEVWQHYLATEGHEETLSFWRYHLASGGKGLTLPCENPEDFRRYLSRQNASRSSAEAPRAAKYQPRAYRDD